MVNPDAISSLKCVTISNASYQKKVSDFLLTGIDNVQSALLINKELNGEPAIIDSGQISVYVNRCVSLTLKQPLNLIKSD